MDNLSITKLMHEGNLIKLYLEAKNEYVSVKQECYIEDIVLKENCDNMIKFLFDKIDDGYNEFGIISKKYTPAFSICLKKIDSTGHILMELDCEICDDENRNHRCKLFVRSNISDVEKFTKKLRRISEDEDTIHSSILDETV